MSGRVLGGCRCDPATATPIASADGVTLYRTKSRRFFIERGDGQLALLTDSETQAWLMCNADATTIKHAFDEAESVHLTVDLPAWLVETMDSRRGRRSRRAVIQAALERFYQI